MTKTVILIVLGALLGGFAGNTIAKRIAERHQHARAVMTLLGDHQGRLDAAAKAGHCADFEAQRVRLGQLQQEIPLALPLAYKDDAVFRKSADALGSAIQAAAVAVPAAGAEPAAAGCPTAAAQVKKIGDTCEDCHRVYD